MSELNIPESWAAVKFGDVFEVRRGASPRPVGDPKYFGKGKVGWLRIADVTREGKIINNTVDTLTDEGVKKSVYINPGEIILSNSGTVGLPCFAGIPLCVHDGFLVFPNAPKEVYSEYLYWFFLSFRSEISKQAKVGTQANLNTEIMRGVDFCLPPYKEQERIVQKIESCFSKIEETEKNLNKIEILLEKYRDSLLAKAFRGELIPQNPDDEPASVLLAKIREERAQNQKGKKKEHEFALISDDEKPFEIPESWEWVRLNEITTQIQYGLTASSSQKGTHKFLRITDITQTGVDWNSVPYCTPTEQDIERLNLQSGDIVFARTGGTVGKSFLIKDAVKNAVFASYLIKVRPNKEIVDQDFLAIFFTSPTYWNYVTGNQRGAAQPNVNGTTLGSMPVPLPPLHEQSEIVKWYNVVAGSISESTKKIIQKRILILKLNESILKKAFEGRLVGQIETEGTGHELLQKILEQKNQAVSAKGSPKKKVAKKVSKKK